MWNSKLSQFVMMGVVMTGLSGCGNSSERHYFGAPDEYSPQRPITIMEARGETVALELELYDYLDKEYGIGEWKAPPPTGVAQISESASIRCPDGTKSENWHLARSSKTLKDFPDPEATWKQITDGVFSLLAPRGFTQRHLQTMPNGDHIARYRNPTTGAQVRINSKKATFIMIDTGCAKGKYPYEGWPQGTEAIPQHLRTTGRVYYGNYNTRQEDDPFIEDWSPITPPTPTPAPPPQTTPDSSPTR